jgi:ABC-type amino acid transport substrate-binding protein/mono/diheme cytochrome c family protein
MTARRLISFLSLWLIVPAALQAGTLRVCANPDNLPFSHDGTPPAGLYVAVADALGKQLGMAVEYVWQGDYSEKAISFAFQSDRCDVYFGLPRLARRGQSYMRLSRPFLRESYALVVPKGQPVKRLSDLRGKRIAVQFRSPAQDLLAVRNDLTTVTCSTPKEAMEALGRGEADAAFIWGPSAGYYNKFMLHGAYRVIPTRGRGLDWSVALGVRREEAGLYRAINAALPKIKPLIASAARTYGLPQGSPVIIGAPGRALPPEASTGGDSRPTASSSPAHPMLLAEAAQANDASRAAVSGQAAATAADANLAEDGRVIFNSNCGHCHGPNAVSGDSYMDLPALLREQGSEMDAFFYRTVTNGIPRLGMPTWGSVLTREQMRKILIFLHAAQQKRSGNPSGPTIPTGAK